MPTPSSYRMPAEWNPHEATWLSWPRNKETWPDNLAAAQQEFTNLVRAIADDEPVRVLAGRPEECRAAEAALGKIDGVEIVALKTDDAWIRDYGPTFVVDRQRGRLGAVGWRYNAWGGKYPPYDSDQENAQRIAAHIGCDFWPVDLCLEGGAIEIDDAGTLLCTKSCALDPNRNTGLEASEIEERICEAIGATQALWLAGDALVGDDTDGHIDQLARFTPSGAILYAWTDDDHDIQQVGLARNLSDLRSGLQRLGQERPLAALPLPAPTKYFGRQIPACYCNFYITNASVIVPTFEVVQDSVALGVIGEHFSGRRVVALPSRNLTVGLGSFHCLTQQQPAQ